MALRKKTGGGSRKGIPNKKTKLLHELMDAAIEARGGPIKCFLDPWIDLMVGIYVEKKQRDGKIRVYQQAPNEFAIKAWAEHRHGRPRQAIDVTSEGKRIKAPIFVVPAFIDPDAGKH